MDEKLKVIKPCGHLYTMGQDYFLLCPQPIPGDSWQRDNCYQFLVTPADHIGIETKGSANYRVFAYERIIVTNSFTIEYMDVLPIHIILSDDIQISHEMEDVENGEESSREEEFPF